MTDDIERSEFGSLHSRREQQPGDRHVAEQTGRNLESITQHIEAHIGEIESVYQELVSDALHIDLHFVPATADRPYQTLVTSGVSALPMNVPNGMEDYSRAELLVTLPSSWPLTKDTFDNERHYWPIRWIDHLGRLPHEYDTWIGWGHTVPNGDPAEVIEDTQFVGMMLTPPNLYNSEFFKLEAESGDIVTFYSLVPLYQEELDLKLAKGAEELENRLQKAQVSTLIDCNRPNAALKQRWLSWN